MKIAIAGATGLIGRQVVDILREQEHEVVGLARSTGVDLLRPDGLTELLDGVDAVIDVTQSPTLDAAEATAFFDAVATNLGHAATTAGVRRTVVLSIVGVDKSPDFGYYVAKLKHEDATRAAAPGAVVLRATQFHEFAGQMLEAGRQGDTAYVMDVPSRPVASAEVAQMLVDLATADEAADTDLAGPNIERLVDQVKRLVHHRGLSVTVEPVEAPDSMAAGSMLPGSNAVIRGPRWDEWLATQP